MKQKVIFCQQECLPRNHSGSRCYSIARINNHTLTEGEAGRDGGPLARALQQRDRARFGPAIHHNKRHPIIAVAKKRASRHHNRIVLCEDRNAGVDLIGITEGAPAFAGRRDIDQDVDPLFFDAER